MSITVNETDAKRLVEKQILGLINEVYFIAQERYKKMSKKAQLELDQLVDSDEDSNDMLVYELKDYNKDSFNVIFPDLKEKDILSIRNRAELILDYIKFLDLQINPRGYNLLRFLVSHY